MTAAATNPAAPAKRRRKRPPPGPVGNSPILPYLLLLPAFLCVAFLLAYPLWLVFQLSLNERAGMNFLNRPVNWGFGNFRVVLSDGKTLEALIRTFTYTAGAIIPGFLGGLGLALLLNRQFPGRRWFRSLVLLPWAVPGVVVSIVFLWMLDTSFGVVNATLRNLGLIEGQIGWYTNPDMALLSVIIPTIWKAFPFFTLTILAALQSIPPSLYEAARMDGASAWDRFTHVTWPGVRGAATLAGILQTLWVLREFDIIYATTGGGPIGATETLGLMVYNEAFSYFRMGTAAAIGMVLLVIAVAVIAIAIKPLRKEYF